MSHPPASDFPQEQNQSSRFEDFGLDPHILKGIHDLGFIRPTPIQARAIPPILEGKDVIGCAQTGTGKTAAFVLPILHRLMKGHHTRNVRALILSPTREIAAQSIDHLNALSRHVRLHGAAIFGGVGMHQQIQALQRGLDIISATPGRLLDHMGSGRVRYHDLQVLVLDEVDRMLDMGFLPDIRRILRALPHRRQNLVFSATMPPEILQLVNEILVHPVMVQIGQRSSAAVGIRQAVYPCPKHLKTDLLDELLRAEGTTSAIVFVRTKRNADKLSRRLQGRGFKVSVLHGDRSQNQRTQALNNFRQGNTQVLVATDIAARGIDVDDISHVINYDIPGMPEDYVHRIGRTGRVDATGDAFSLMDRSEEPQLRDIERALKQPLPRVTLPNFDYNRAAPMPPPQGQHHNRHFHGRWNRHRR